MKIKNFESFINENDNNDNLLQLEVGDTVNVECYTGMGTGGETTVDKILYKYDTNTGEKYKVIVVDGNHQFDSRTGDAITPPTMYYIWVSPKDKLHEELNPDTYLNAADKLSKKGHKSRANKLIKHQKSQVKNVKPVKIEMYGQEFTLDHNSIIYISNSQNDGMFTIDFDPSKLDADWDDPNIPEEENENREINKVMLEIKFYTDRKNPGIIKNDVSGIIIPDRKNARKILMFLKDYFNYYGEPLKGLVDNLTVNDLYFE